VVNAPFGVALGLDQDTPGLMRRRPRPRGDWVLTTPLRLIAGLVGLFMATTTLVLIEVGLNQFGNVAIGLVAFVLMLVVAAYECRSETETVFRVQQREAQLDRPRRDHRRVLADPGRLHAPTARHHGADRPAVGAGRGRRARARAGVGGGQVDRPPAQPASDGTDPSAARALTETADAIANAIRERGDAPRGWVCRWTAASHTAGPSLGMAPSTLRRGLAPLLVSASPAAPREQPSRRTVSTASGSVGSGGWAPGSPRASAAAGR